MGKNNRQRRKAKKKGSKASLRPRADLDPRYVSIAGGIASTVGTIVFEGKEPPPGIIAEADKAMSFIPVMQPAWEATKGLVRYLNTGELPLGSPEKLLALKPIFQRADSEDEFDLLLLYAYMGSTKAEEVDFSEVLNFLHNSRLDEYFESFCELAIKATSPKEVGNASAWVYWSAFDPHVKKLGSSVKAVLRLKHLKPTLKSVASLEEALSRSLLDRSSSSGRALQSLLTYTFQSRLNLSERSNKAWDAYPHLCQWADLREAEEAPGLTWGSATLMESAVRFEQRIRDIDTSEMSFRDQVRFEALKTRHLLTNANATEMDLHSFSTQLYRLCKFLASGVPPAEQSSAKRSLDAVCDWVCQSVYQQKLASVPLDAVQIMQREMPDDYRAAVLFWIARKGKEQIKQPEKGGFQNVRFEAFYLGFARLRYRTEAFVQLFFDALSTELKKELMISCCRRALVGGSSKNREVFTWDLIVEHLFQLESSPMREVLRGQACEGEFLLYVALASTKRGQGLQWLRAEQVGTLVRRIPAFFSDGGDGEYLSPLLNQIADTYPPILFSHFESLKDVLFRTPDWDNRAIFLRALFDWIEEGNLPEDMEGTSLSLLQMISSSDCERSLRQRARAVKKKLSGKKTALNRARTVSARQPTLFPEEAEKNER